MYAVIKTGGKQYRVSEGDVLRVEKIKAEGDTISFDHVLLVGGGDELKVGTPYVNGAKVEATLLSEGRAKKIVVFKKKLSNTQQVVRR